MTSRIRLLALGNELLGDDGVGLYAARMLAEDAPEDIEIVESSRAGMELLELLEGCDQAILLDAVKTGSAPPGTVLEYFPEELRRIVAPSPHYAGIPEVLELAGRLRIHFPQDLRILALEVEDPYTLRENWLSPAVREALPRYVEKVRTVIEDFRKAYA